MATIGSVVLTPNDNHFQLSSKVALRGNLALLGASLDDVNGTDSGSAYLFDVQTALQLAKFMPVDGAQGDRFGSAVAFCNDIAVLGARGVADMGYNAGAVYLFDVSSGTQLAKLYSSDPVSNNLFGAYLVSSGDRFVASGHVGGIGIACVFDCVSGQQQIKLAASDGESGNWFGLPGVAFDGSLAVLGASGDNRAGASAGAAYVFDLDPRPTLAIPAGDGLLCANSTKRYAVRITNANGFVSPGSFGAFASPGSSLNDQFWFRDQVNSCGAGGFNFTGGWNVTWR